MLIDNESYINSALLSISVKEVLNFIRGKLDTTGLKFHYLRIGKASPLLDQLREASKGLEITWEQYEAESFAEFHFSESYADFDGALINLGISDENAGEFRQQFWQDFIWKTKDMPLLLAIVYPDTTTFGSLSKGELMEALSLIRLTDRPFELFENRDDVDQQIIEWLSSLSSIVHRIEREPEISEEN